MELKILEETKNKLIIQVKGETHTFCNALKSELWNDKTTKNAGYAIDHPFVGIPKILVETDNTGNPKKSLTEAAKRLNKKAAELEKLSAKIK